MFALFEVSHQFSHLTRQEEGRRTSFISNCTLFQRGKKKGICSSLRQLWGKTQNNGFPSIAHATLVSNPHEDEVRWKTTRHRNLIREAAYHGDTGYICFLIFFSSGRGLTLEILVVLFQGRGLVCI